MKKRPAKPARPNKARAEKPERPERGKRKSGLQWEDFDVESTLGKDLDITSVRLCLLDDEKSSAVALASITLNDSFVISGIRVIESKNGLFCAMPARKDKEDVYHDIAFPLTKKGREALNEGVLDAYSQAGGK